MSNYTSRFSFLGTPTIPKTGSRMAFFKELISRKNNKTKMARMNFGVKESDNNLAFVEAFDSANDVIKTMNTDNEKIEIDWENRFDEDVIQTVAGYKKYTVDLGDECGGRKEFISQYDAILHLKEWLPKYKGKVVVTGQLRKDWYKGKYFDKFVFQNVYAADEEQKSRLSLTMDVFYNKDSIDKADFKEDKKIYLNGYISQYINKDEGNKYIPQQFVFNTSKYDMNNETHKNRFEYRMKYIDIKNKTVVHIPWDVVLLRGAESVEFDESMLTKAQKEQIELGIKTLDDFKPKGQVFGDKVYEYRLLDPKLTNDFTDGVVDTEMKMSEFEESIYSPPVDEKLDDVVPEKESESVPDSVSIDVEVDDLF